MPTTPATTESPGGAAKHRAEAPARELVSGKRAARESSSGRGAAVLRALSVLFVLVLWLAIGAFGGIKQGQLSTVQENDPAAFLPQDAESTRADEVASQFRDNSALPGLVVVERRDGEALAADDLEAVRAFAADVPSMPLPEEQTVEDVLTGPVVVVPAQDATAALVPISIDADVANDIVGQDEERIVNLVVEQLRDGTAELPESLQAWVTGPAGSVADLVAAFGGIDGILLVVALIVVLVILIVVYRSPFLPFTVLLSAVFALCLAALVVFAAAAQGWIVLNGQSQGILSILVVGAATDYSLLLVARYREALRNHDDPVAALREAWRACLEPIAASAGTVIVGLLCLLMSDLASNASLGPVAAIGIVASVAAALSFLPAMLLLGRRWIFWPKRPRVGEIIDPRKGLWALIPRVVGAHARPVWVATAALLIGVAAFVPTLRANGTSQTDIFLQETESVTGLAVLEKHFDIGTVQPTDVVTDAKHMDDVIAAIQRIEGVETAEPVRDEPAGFGGGAPAGMPAGVGGEGGPPAGVAGAGGPPDEATGAPGTPTGATPSDAAMGGMPPEAAAQAAAEPAPVREIDGRVLVEVTIDQPAESTEGVAIIAELRDAVHEVDVESLVGGASAESLDTQEVARQDLVTIIPIVLIAIFLMLALLLRSLLAPALILAVNVVSFLTAMGLAAIFFNHVFKFPGADATVPLYGFVFLVALGIDYTIFLMTRAREEALRVGTRRGVLRALSVTGGVITSAGLVLAATFGALAVIPLLFLVQLAFIVATGVLIDTFLVRSLLVSGLVYDIGDAVWWPFSRRMREATDRLDAYRIENLAPAQEPHKWRSRRRRMEAAAGE